MKKNLVIATVIFSCLPGFINYPSLAQTPTCSLDYRQKPVVNSIIGCTIADNDIDESTVDSDNSDNNSTVEPPPVYIPPVNNNDSPSSSIETMKEEIDQHLFGGANNGYDSSGNCVNQAANSDNYYWWECGGDHARIRRNE